MSNRKPHQDASGVKIVTCTSSDCGHFVGFYLFMDRSVGAFEGVGGRLEIPIAPERQPLWVSLVFQGQDGSTHRHDFLATT